VLAGELQPDDGSVRYNPAVSAAYFTQNAQEQLDLDATAVDAVLSAGGILPENARSLLGRMRISGSAADKPVRLFSGGERRRIMLARLMAHKSDLLLLDEPTNDLDIESCEALESVLDEYEGAVVVVSHDRYLLDRLCDRVLWIEDGSWGVLEGGYAAYESLQSDRKREGRGRREKREKTPGAKARQDSRLTPLKIRSQLATKIAQLERDIERFDGRKSEIEALFATTEIYEDRPRVKKLQDELDNLARRSEELFLRWETGTKELEKLDSSIT
jgi:ATP-binding cassette subfamily F protein 3